MAKQAVAVRLTPETIEAVDAYAKTRGVSRQVVLESFVMSGLDNSTRGVPDLPKDSTPSRQEQEANKAALKSARQRVAEGESYAEIMRGRQVNLNRRSA